MSNELAAWERQPDESAKAYAAFCLYRDIDVKSRSMLAAYRMQAGKEAANSLSGMWIIWSTSYRWTERVRAYDVDQEQKARKVREAQHAADLEQYRTRQLQLSRVGMAAAIKLLSKSVKRLDELSEAEIKPGMLPAFFRAAAHVAEVSGDAEATALGLQELTALLEDGEA